MQRSSERGIALIITMFMVLILSVIASSLVFVSQTETLSSLNYRTTSQVRYAAESGIHVAANHLMYTYVPPDTAGADPIGAYDLTTSPVRYIRAPARVSQGSATNRVAVAADCCR